jgi:hypothetical protein
LFVESEAEMMARHGRMLAGLAERAYAVACALADDVASATSRAEKAQSARAFHEVSRSVRQTLALEQRLRREARRAALQERDADEARRTRLRSERAETLRKAVKGLIWTEYEGEDVLEAKAGLERLLNELVIEPGFSEADVHGQIERLMTGVARWLARPDRLVWVEDDDDPETGRWEPARPRVLDG